MRDRLPQYTPGGDQVDNVSTATMKYPTKRDAEPMLE